MPSTLYVHSNGRKVGQFKDGVRLDYLTDALGSITATKNQSQQIERTFRYKPYGALLSSTGTGEIPKYLWTGNTGSRNSAPKYANQYNVARHYGSLQAAWTTVDALWPKEWAYGYVRGNPVSGIDPYGFATLNLSFFAFIHKSRGAWGTYPFYHTPRDMWDECQFGTDNRDFGQHPTSRMWFAFSVSTTLLGRYPPTDTRVGNHIGQTKRRCRNRLRSDNWGFIETRDGRIVINKGNVANTGKCTTVFWTIAAGIEGFTPRYVRPEDAAIWYELHYIVSAHTACVQGKKKYFIAVELEGGHTRFPDFEGYGSLGGDKKVLYEKMSPHPAPNAGTLGQLNIRAFFGRTVAWEVSKGDIPSWCK